MTNAAVSLLMSTMPDRVARGATALDRARPGWYQELRPDQINGASMTMCVVGQLWGSWDAAMQVAIYLEPQEGPNDPVAVVRRYGFSAGSDEPEILEQYKIEWGKQIGKRRRADIKAQRNK